MDGWETWGRAAAGVVLIAMAIVLMTSPRDDPAWYTAVHIAALLAGATQIGLAFRAWRKRANLPDA